MGFGVKRAPRRKNRGARPFDKVTFATGGPIAEHPQMTTTKSPHNSRNNYRIIRAVITMESVRRQTGSRPVGCPHRLRHSVFVAHGLKGGPRP
jgi:hypothetical protein